MALRVNQLTSGHCKKLKTSPDHAVSGVSFMDAKDLYLKLRGQGRAESFAPYTERNVNYVIEAIGNKDLMAYEPSDGGRFRDWLTEKGLAFSSVKRVFSTIRAITNLAVAEHGLDIRSPFANCFVRNLQKFA